MRDLINILTEAQDQSVLIVVHPGSACGSANFNLGKSLANGERDFLAQDIANWREGILVVDGTYSDELPSYPQLNSAITNTLGSAHSAGKLSLRIFACDDATDGWEALVGQVLSHIPRETKLELTGAWYFSDDSAGCVNAVYDQAVALGFRSINVRDSAVHDPEGDGHEDEDYEDASDL